MPPRDPNPRPSSSQAQADKTRCANVHSHLHITGSDGTIRFGRTRTQREDKKMKGAMSALEFKATQKALGLTNEDLAGMLQVQRRTIAAWRGAEEKVPALRVQELQAMLADKDKAVRWYYNRRQPITPQTRPGLAREYPDGFYLAALGDAIRANANLVAR